MRPFTAGDIFPRYRARVRSGKTKIGFDNTITEDDLDSAARNFVAGLETENDAFETDLAVDGLSDSFVSRLLGFFGAGRTRR